MVALCLMGLEVDLLDNLALEPHDIADQQCRHFSDPHTGPMGEQQHITVAQRISPPRTA